MKPLIIVSKLGSAFHPRRMGTDAGEQGETEGIIRRLMQRGDVAVLYFGRIADGGHDLMPCPYIEPYMKERDGSKMSAASDEKDQEDAWEIDHVSVVEWCRQCDAEPLAAIHVAGYAATGFSIGNPDYTNTQDCAVRYIGPPVALCHHLGIRRMVVNNDPRTYPREKDMTWRWPDTQPAALLDQCDREVVTKIGGLKYRRRSVWARPESWAYQIRRENTDERPVVLVAHAHIADGCAATIPCGDDRATAFDKLLADGVCEALDMHVYGRGWDVYHRYDSRHMHEPVKPDTALDLFNSSTCCPCVSAVNWPGGFYTGKVYVAEAQGCIPLLYGRGEACTWDPRGVILPLDSPWRVQSAQDLINNVRLLASSESIRSESRELWQWRCRPHWGLFDEMVQRLIDGGGYHDPDWFERFGGYRPA